ncbi:MAG: hypothetical protein ACKVS8_11015 [Phycisphaerales bacterium]
MTADPTFTAMLHGMWLVVVSLFNAAVQSPLLAIIAVLSAIGLVWLRAVPRRSQPVSRRV